MRFLLPITIILFATNQPGCSVTEADAGFIVTWSLHAVEGTEITCVDADAATVRFRVSDARGRTHEYVAACEAYSFETRDWDIAAGKGRVTGFLVSNEGDILAKTRKTPVDFAPGRLSNVLAHQIFETSIEAPPVEGPEVTWYWRITNDKGENIHCDRVGGRYLRFTLEDAAGEAHSLATLPCRSPAGHNATVATPVAEGDARYTVELLGRRQQLLYSETFDISVPEGSGDLNISEVSLKPTPFFPEGDAGITWEWRYGTEYFDESTCDALGIDYVRLWIWQDALEGWWSDPWNVSRVSCAAFDRSSDDPIFGNESYSGYFADSILPAGDHRLMLGFYRYPEKNELADQMLFFDTAGGSGSPLSGTLLPNEETEHGTNLLTTIIDPDTPIETGVFKIALEWASDEGDLLTTCTAAGIHEMGYSLMNGDIPVVEATYGWGFPCRDWLELTDIPLLDAPYDLIVSGHSLEDGLAYYTVCEGLVPESNVTLEEADGLHCRVTP